MAASARTHSRLRRARAFTLVEIMIVAAIIGIVVSIAAPGWYKQRTLSQQRSCQENLQKINGAKEQWALENKIGAGTSVSESDLYKPDSTGYLKLQPRCLAEGIYTYNVAGQDATCSVTTPLDHNAQP